MLTGQILRVNAQMLHQNANFMENVFHFVVGQVNDIDESNQLDDIGDYFSERYSDTIEDVVSDNVDGTELQFSVAEQSDGIFNGIGSRPFVFSGLNISQALPLGAACLVRFPLTFGGHMAGKYLGGLTESGQADSVWNSAVISSAAAWGLQFSQDIVLGSITILPIVWREDLSFSNLAGDVIVRSVIAYQRRRKQGVGA